ncbi:MAG: BTAD domain-containing putative transcriptional regulator [Candidatus Limnocylindrales bacterium]
MAQRDALREPSSHPVSGLRQVVRSDLALPAQPRLAGVAVGPGRGNDVPRSPAEHIVDQYPVSRAKVTPPPLREATLSRDRLLDWLERHIHRRCITVVAETGFGKTTLLTDFTQHGPVRCLWYRLDPGDRDPISFLNYVVAACRELMPNFGTRTLALLRDMLANRPPTDLITSTLIAELTALADRSTVLILDDYHLVDEDPRARGLVTRLLAEAPDRMTFVLLSRQPIRLSLGRLTARGEAPHLSADDLRFSADETERLFRDVYRLPLETEVLQQVEERTEGWAASLQLLHSSIHGRSARDVRAFMHAISGAEGPLYDYLAEEVMGDLSPEVQRFLTCTAILDDVRVEFAQAIFAADDPPPSAETVQAWAIIGQQAGLMSRRSALTSDRRYHPLMREFLERRLALLATPDEVRGMHLRVAMAAEGTDWLAACRHYIKANHESDALRVLVANAVRVLGSGQWGDGAELIRTLRASDEEPRIAVILAREDIYAGRIEEGLARLDRFDLSTLDATTRALVVLARVHGWWWLGHIHDPELNVNDLVASSDIPEPLRAIARGIQVTRGTTTDMRLGDAVPVLATMAADEEAASLPFYAGVSRYNLAFTRLEIGDFREAIEDAHRALDLFAQVPGVPEETYGAHFALGRAHMELGQFDLGREHLTRAISGTTMGAVEQWLEAAALLPVLGESSEARELLARASAHPAAQPAHCQYVAALAYARQAMASGDLSAARRALGERYDAWQAPATCAWATWLHLRAIVDLTSRDYEKADGRITAGQALAVRQGAGLLEGRFRLSRAILGGDPDGLSDAFARATPMDLLSSAEAIVRNLDRIGATPATLRESLSAWPQRWLPLLRQVIADPTDPAAPMAAALLDEYGELSDVRSLRGLSKSRHKAFRGSDLGRGLAKRRSPTLIVHDLGRSSFEIGTRRVHLSSIRRRSAGLLCFLLTRNGHLATRDQVLDALWPDVDPSAGVNSLNQTLYFLRRDIEPEYDDDYSAPYVHFESDLVWLDRELVSAESRDFQERVSRALAAPRDLQESMEALSLYRGRFAPEFEYEEWATAWRDLLHSQYLHLAETVVARLIQEGRLLEAADLAVDVLRVDADAEHLERELIWLYSTLGARSAAAEQYGHYADVQRTEYGVEPPSLDEIASGH